MSTSTIQKIFYSFWVGTLLIQSYFVELRGDEAYYWMYSKQLAWGYFDHPPIVALFVKAGYLLLKNELGVRLLFVLASTLTLWVIEKIINPTDLKLFYMLVASIAFLQVGMVFGGGMFAIPDFPLLLFIALFFYTYKQYLANDSWQAVIPMALFIALMLMAKYHGILVVGFTVFSNLSLLKRKSFWVIAILSVCLLIPHLAWQAANDFPSLKYHFIERSSKEYRIAFTLEYLISQPFILGPIIGAILIYASAISRPKNLFERSLAFTTWGTYLFFFLMSFKGKVEGNWTIITLVPLVCLGYNPIQVSGKLTRMVGYSFGISLGLILFLRILLIANVLPYSQLFNKSSGAKIWSKELRDRTDGLPIAFHNSYQRASLYEFYGAIPAISINNVFGRKNQFTVWDTEAKFQGQTVAEVMVAENLSPRYDSIQFYKHYLPYYRNKNFRSASNILIQHNLAKKVFVKPLDTLHTLIKLSYRNAHVRDLEAYETPTILTYSFFQFTQAIEMRASDLIIKNDMMTNHQFYPIFIIAPRIPGRYDFYLSINFGDHAPAINSDKITFVVE